jgi:acetyl-CoA carboxylase biotin carboxyl carrier protein
MTIDEIKQIIELFNESGVAELEVQRGENRVRVRRNSSLPQEYIMPAMAHAPVYAAPAQLPAMPAPPSESNAAAHASAPGAPASAGPATAEAPTRQQLIVDERHELVKSPIVGTYYDSPAPGAPVFVKVGDQVEAGQVLCIVESMKLMNEIESELAGTIVAKLVENGRPVEYGEALFAILPR